MARAAWDGSCSRREEVMEGRPRRWRRVHCDGVWKLGAGREGGQEVRER